MYPSRFHYEAPRSLDEAFDVLRVYGDEAKILARGQSLIPLIKLRFAAPAAIVDINNIPGLDYHEEDSDGSLNIGALCRHRTLERSPLLRSKNPTMAVGPFQNTLQADGIAVRARVPAPRGTRGTRLGTYLKLGRRVGDFATVGLAVVLETSGGTINRTGLALTGVGPSNIQCTAAEQSLAGKTLNASTIDQAARLAAEAAQPKTDVRGSAEYKRHVVHAFVTRALSNPQARAA
jgi:aerobic carbon-monoxide dehydrogenase medium subunit